MKNGTCGDLSCMGAAEWMLKTDLRDQIMLAIFTCNASPDAKEAHFTLYIFWVRAEINKTKICLSTGTSTGRGSGAQRQTDNYRQNQIMSIKHKRFTVAAGYNSQHRIVFTAYTDASRSRSLEALDAYYYFVAHLPRQWCMYTLDVVNGPLTFECAVALNVV